MVGKESTMFGLVALVLGGCTPHNAVVEGNWFVWLAANTSGTVDEGKLDALESDATMYECSGRGWDTEKGRFEDGYVGPANEEEYASARFIGGQCPQAWNSSSEAYDGDYAPYCDPDSTDSEVLARVLAREEQCETVDALEFHTWLQDDGFYALTGAMEPWRTEAIITSEGDLQLTVHHWLGNGQDSRMHFTVAPDFAPITCTADDSGDAVVEYVDGASWVSQWSADEDGYSIYYLNAGSYQVNPSDSDTWWYFTSEWNSGYGFSKFAAEELSSHPGDYGNYDENGEGDNFQGVTDREDPESEENIDAYVEMLAELEVAAEGWEAEVYDVAGARANGEPAFTHKIEDNLWRPINTQTHGLDGWAGLHSSWVRIANSSNITEGGKVSGDFQILYDGTESGSRYLVTGTFEIPELEADKWVYPVLDEVKRAENGTQYCGGAAMP